MNGKVRPTRYYSKKQEKSVAKAVKGKIQSNSGAGAFQKGDVKSPYFLIECKTKTSESVSVSIKKEWLIKNREEAFAMGKRLSTLAFDFGDGDNYYILDEGTFKLFNELIEESGMFS